jgi:hypothetical protein
MNRFDYSPKSDTIINQIKSENTHIILVGENEFEPFLSHYFPINGISDERYYRPQKTTGVIMVENQNIIVLIASICRMQENCTQILNKVENVCSKNNCTFTPY